MHRRPRLPDSLPNFDNQKDISGNEIILRITGSIRDETVAKRAESLKKEEEEILGRSINLPQIMTGIIELLIDDGVSPEIMAGIRSYLRQKIEIVIPSEDSYKTYSGGSF